MSVWKAVAFAFAELGAPAFFLAGAAGVLLGRWTAVFVLPARLLGAYARTTHFEGWALFLPGRLGGTVRHGPGLRPPRFAAAASLSERLLLGPLAANLIA